MTAAIASVGLIGVEGALVEVQVGWQDGLPGIDVTGLPAASLKEARYRVRASLRAAGFDWPNVRMVANFAPAGMPKHGTAFDLPLAIGVLVLDDTIGATATDGAVFFGELALDGTLRSVPGAVNAALAARAAGRERLYLPEMDAAVAALVPGIDVIGVRRLTDLIAALRGELTLTAATAAPASDDGGATVDLAWVRGQARARRAIEVAAAGGHNLLMVGPPGCGKTLLARALLSILPPLSRAEALDVMRVHSATRGGFTALPAHRPFRAPHATSSYAALVGGGNPPRPGEVSLAHRGVLFLDEVAEFGRHTLDAMRAPLEDRSVTVARRGMTAHFPASFMLVCAMNPCPCGYAGDPSRECRCPRSKIDRYQQRISGPLLDRIDIQVTLSSVSADLLAARPKGEASAVVRRRVIAARRTQAARSAQGEVALTNAELTLSDLDTVAPLGRTARVYLAHVAQRLGLSARAWHRIVRLARTIADLAGDAAIGRRHLAEAVTYRRGISGAAGPHYPSPTGSQQGAQHGEANR